MFTVTRESVVDVWFAAMLVRLESAVGLAMWLVYAVALAIQVEADHTNLGLVNRSDAATNATLTLFTPQECLNFVRHCGYRVATGL